MTTILHIFNLSSEENTWEPEWNLKLNCSDAIKEFKAKDCPDVIEEFKGKNAKRKKAKKRKAGQANKVCLN